MLAVPASTSPCLLVPSGTGWSGSGSGYERAAFFVPCLVGAVGCDSEGCSTTGVVVVDKETGALEFPGNPDVGPVGSCSSSRFRVSGGLQPAAVGFGFAAVADGSADAGFVARFHQEDVAVAVEAALGLGRGSKSGPSAPVTISPTSLAV